MAKDAQMSIKMEPELRNPLIAVAASKRRPAAQIVRELMRFYIAQNEMPNALTAETIVKARRGEDAFSAKDAEDLFRQLDRQWRSGKPAIVYLCGHP
jgi:predicted DNA-binding protein